LVYDAPETFYTFKLDEDADFEDPDKTVKISFSHPEENPCEFSIVLLKLEGKKVSNCKKAVGNGPNFDFDLSELKDSRDNPMKFDKG